MDYTSLILNNQWYLLYLSVIMITAGYAKDQRWFAPAYIWIVNNTKSKRAVVALISGITGVLPITGRVAVSAGFLDTIAPKDKEKRKVYGVIDYLSTHHYYLWSPIEKSVIIPMAALGISYWTFLGYMLPLLVVMFGVIGYYIFSVLKEDDVEINVDGFNVGEKYLEKNPLKYINLNTIVLLAGIIILGNITKEYTNEIQMFIENNTASLIHVSLISFLGSLFLGSSSRFAAITAIAVTIYGVEYLPWFFAIDYAGYMLSPTHKCLSIGKMYFGTSLKEYYKSIIILCSSIIAMAAVITFVPI